jgi:hypothetical protein
MTKTLVLLVALAMAFALAARAEDHVPGGPETVVVQGGTLKLCALLWHPEGHGPFPAVLFNHGPTPVTTSCWWINVGTNWSPYHHTTLCSLLLSVQKACKTLSEPAAMSV